MIRAKNYETVSKFVKVMTKILWPLFFRTRCSVYSLATKLSERKRIEENSSVSFFETQTIRRALVVLRPVIR